MAVLVSSSQSIAPMSAAWFAYRGEIWTDARGYATVRPPAERPGGSGDVGRRSISDVHNRRRK